MTNQAAQTMPEPVTASMCPSSDYAKGWNDCLAALSQTAGVADGPLSGKYGDVLRPFVIQMERELHANAGKGDRPGWLKMRPEVALLEIYYHLAKLQKAVKDDNGPGIIEYAADVANMSMMLLDICGGLALIEYEAPAASGGEDQSGYFINGKPVSEDYHNGFLDGLCRSPGSTQGKRESAASVSERARIDMPVIAEDVAERCRTFATGRLVELAMEISGRYAMWGTKVLHDALLAYRNEIQQRIARYEAIEQALTQQRGECEASVSVKQKWPKRHQFPKPDEHGNETGSIGEHAYAEGWNACLDEAKRMSGVPMPLKGKKGVVVVEDTTPQPSADAVREYVTELRAQADQKMGVAGACAHDGDRARYKSAAQLLRRVADELESLLSAASGEKGVDDTKRLDWIARQGGYEFDFGILNDQPSDGDWFVHGMVGSGQGATFRDAIDAAIKEEAGGQDANTDILDTLAFKTENGDAGRGSVTYIALVASGEADHQQNAAQGGGEK